MHESGKRRQVAMSRITAATTSAFTKVQIGRSAELMPSRMNYTEKRPKGNAAYFLGESRRSLMSAIPVSRTFEIDRRRVRAQPTAPRRDPVWRGGRRGARSRTLAALPWRG